MLETLTSMKHIWIHTESIKMTLVRDPKQLLFRNAHSVSIWARRHIFLFNKKLHHPVQQEDMSSCPTRRHVFMPNKTTCLLVQLAVEKEDMSSCAT